MDLLYRLPIQRLRARLAGRVRGSTRRATAFALLLLAGLGCEGAPSEPGPLPDLDLRAVEIVSGLVSPVYLTSPGGDSRLFIVEQPGRIRIVENGQLVVEPFLDIQDRVVFGDERGLLGLAFHPDYGRNGLFYVNYTGAGGATRIERYQVTGDRARADRASARLILSVAQPFTNHNGGMIEFGPDGMLYIALGDGGSGGDPQGHGQNLSTLLGSLLRIDVDGGDPYRVPSSNPYVGVAGARPEIWASGLRNPWRFSIDRAAGVLYIADVGQQHREEVNAVGIGEGGLNYGWNVMEGSLCYPPPSGCSTAGFVLPIVEYDRVQPSCAVTGGYVYRGAAIPILHGHYFYSDYCRGGVRSFRRTSDGRAVDPREWPVGTLGNVTSFGEDASGELYVLVQQGRVYRLQL